MSFSELFDLPCGCTHSCKGGHVQTSDEAFFEEMGRLRKENKELKAAYDAAHGELVRANNQLAECREVANELRVSDEMEQFSVKHYSSDERPIIKGNGFDGLEIGSDREEAEDFVAWVNKLIASIKRDK